MTTLQIKMNDTTLYKSLSNIAKKENRSISQEVIYILDKYLSKPQQTINNSIEQFLNLSYEDERSADEIIEDQKSITTRTKI